MELSEVKERLNEDPNSEIDEPVDPELAILLENDSLGG